MNAREETVIWSITRADQKVLSLTLCNLYLSRFTFNFKNYSHITSKVASLDFYTLLHPHYPLVKAFSVLCSLCTEPPPFLLRGGGVCTQATLKHVWQGIDKQDLTVELGLIFFCATKTSLTSAKTEYILAYKVLLFILKRSI